MVAPGSGAARAGHGDGLVRAGVIVFAVGCVAILAVFLPFAVGHENRALPLNLAAGVLPPLGLLLALAGLIRGARNTARVNRAAQR